jgi:hypothetical protein
MASTIGKGRIEFDTAERAIRQIALARKNALFAGHDMGAENWAIAALLIETWKLHSVDPVAGIAYRRADALGVCQHHGVLRIRPPKLAYPHLASLRLPSPTLVIT